MTRSKQIKTTNEVIKEIFLAHGFKIPPELDDMRPYVYEAARALLKHYGVWMIDPIDPKSITEFKPIGVVSTELKPDRPAAFGPDWQGD